ncbi:hypothetical protein N2605_27385 [Bradyrhizobium yuanmingense]|uniref:hypothetical protein n=1 Tax=Bradyrhizobium yuanmingense TaxID=108015 RepID=UPI0021A28530|nr:hypothetical protein [Bradyrhizobium sp. CB1024]UWU83225.1 hypothetical protein N2605_27385 [Bradyrhizobium sp. CB1024]
MLALELATHRRPLWLGMPAMAPLGVVTGSGLANSRASSTLSDVVGQRPSQSRRLEQADRQPAVEGAVPTRSAISPIGIPAAFNLIHSRTWRIANLSSGSRPPSQNREAGP